MRAGIFVPQGWRLDLAGIPYEEQWPRMHDVAVAAEALGFESVWVYDHFHTVPIATDEVTHEAWTLMGALAVTTSRIRLGQMCTCNSYRPPSYLAKVAATVDVLSGGRLEMGIGAGWYEEEYLAYGYPFPRPAVRIGQLAEAVEIMKRMWTEDEVHFEGKHYQLEGAVCRPRPVQEPHIPFWVAGGGEQLTLRVAAEHAAYTNFGNDLDEFVDKSAKLTEHCREVGRDYDEIVRSSNFNILCAPTEQAVADRRRWMEEHFAKKLPPERVERTVRNFADFSGTPEQLIEKLRSWRDAGLSYGIFYFAEAAYDQTGFELFAREVVPNL
ncbi:MAG: LLM class F420-dependent oxidoreductase [Acidimicrobiia bacterium]|nr:LLM class F420-dependent oxidoreductase [Acidimicrobiia bacterium]